MTDHPGGHGRRRLRRLLLAVVLVAGGLALLVWLARPEAVLRALGRVAPRQLPPLLLTGLLPLVVWGVSLRLVFAGVGIRLGTARAIPLFVASVFMNGVTPLGQVGGDPPSGALIAAVGGTTFERGLAAIATVNAANRVAVVLLGVTGLAWLGGDAAAAGITGGVVLAVTGWVVLAGLAVAAWVRRDAVVGCAGPPLADVVVRVASGLPLVPVPSRSSVVGRLRGFVAALERLAADPRRLAAVVVLGAAGHLAVAATLWLALAALDARVPLAVVLLVLPLAKLSGFLPTPGGAGGATALLAGLLVGLAGVAAPVAVVAALLYRFAAFWVPTVLGGLVTVGLVAVAGGD